MKILAECYQTLNTIGIDRYLPLGTDHHTQFWKLKLNQIYVEEIPTKI